MGLRHRGVGVRLFFLRRLLGVALIGQGLVTLLTPFRPGWNLAVARKIARVKGAYAVGPISSLIAADDAADEA